MTDRDNNSAEGARKGLGSGPRLKTEAQTSAEIHLAKALAESIRTLAGSGPSGEQALRQLCALGFAEHEDVKVQTTLRDLATGAKGDVVKVSLRILAKRLEAGELAPPEQRLPEPKRVAPAGPLEPGGAGEHEHDDWDDDDIAQEVAPWPDEKPITVALGDGPPMTFTPVEERDGETVYSVQQEGKLIGYKVGSDAVIVPPVPLHSNAQEKEHRPEPVYQRDRIVLRGVNRLETSRVSYRDHAKTASFTDPGDEREVDEHDDRLALPAADELEDDELLRALADNLATSKHPLHRAAVARLYEIADRLDDDDPGTADNTRRIAELEGRLGRIEGHGFEHAGKLKRYGARMAVLVDQTRALETTTKDIKTEIDNLVTASAFMDERIASAKALQDQIDAITEHSVPGLEQQIDDLKQKAHPPFDFTDLIKRLENVEGELVRRYAELVDTDVNLKKQVETLEKFKTRILAELGETEQTEEEKAVEPAAEPLHAGPCDSNLPLGDCEQCELTKAKLKELSSGSGSE